MAMREELDERALLFSRAAAGRRRVAVVDAVRRLAHRLVRVLKPLAGRRARQRHQAVAGRRKTGRAKRTRLRNSTTRASAKENKKMSLDTRRLPFAETHRELLLVYGARAEEALLEAGARADDLTVALDELVALRTRRTEVCRQYRTTGAAREERRAGERAREHRRGRGARRSG